MPAHFSIPGIGVIYATAIYSATGNGSQFKNGRELAVLLGLTPLQASSGNSFKSGGITRRGNRYLRSQLVHGARAALLVCKKQIGPVEKPVSRWRLECAACLDTAETRSIDLLHKAIPEQLLFLR